MRPVFRLGLGGALGRGDQWMSWIHVEDLARLALFAVEDTGVRGPLNASAPWPVRQRDFARTLGHTLHRPAFFRIPAFLLRAFLGGLAAELLESRRVVPAAAIAAGLVFGG
jgi:NAD dependent epimerase/dehydratase family enzyme